MNLNKFLIRSKICDADGYFSHTSLLLLVAIGRMAAFPADAYTVAILTLALGHSNAKRYASHKSQSSSVLANERMAKVEAEVQKLVSAQSLKNLGRG